MHVPLFEELQKSDGDSEYESDDESEDESDDESHDESDDGGRPSQKTYLLKKKKITFV